MKFYEWIILGTGFVVTTWNCSSVYEGDFFTATHVPAAPYQATSDFLTFWVFYSPQIDWGKYSNVVVVYVESKDYPTYAVQQLELEYIPGNYRTSRGKRWNHMRGLFCLRGASRLIFRVDHKMNGSVVAIDDIETRGHLLTDSGEVETKCGEFNWENHRGSISCDFDGNIGPENHYVSCGWREDLFARPDFSHVAVAGSFIGIPMHRDNITNKVLRLTVFANRSDDDVLSFTSASLNNAPKRFMVMSTLPRKINDDLTDFFFYSLIMRY